MKKAPVHKTEVRQKENPEGVRHQQPADVDPKTPCKAKEVGHRRCDCGRIGCGNKG